MPDFSKVKRDAYIKLLQGGHRRGYAAELVGMTEQGVILYRKKHPEFEQLMLEAECRCNEAVEMALFRKATGCRLTDVEYDRDGNKVRTLEKEVAPDTVAIQVWLYNRDPDRWTDKRQIRVDNSDMKARLDAVVGAIQANLNSDLPEG